MSMEGEGAAREGCAMLELDTVSSGYGAIQALDGVSLRVERGEIVALIGANGAGKTTLLMTVLGEPRARAGRIRFDGVDITALPTHAIAQRGLALVPEGRRVFPALTVEENLLLGAYHGSRAAREAGLQVGYEMFPRLWERRRQRGGTLSGGEQQMLAIARALMSRPRLLLLDEPSLGLAPLVIARIFEALQQIRNDGTTIFLVEQNAHKALGLADRAYVLETGRLVLSGSGDELLRDEQVRRAYLGA